MKTRPDTYSIHPLFWSICWWILIFAFFPLAEILVLAQEGNDAGEKPEMIQPRRLVDAHTAGILPRASFDFETRIFPSGSNTIRGCGLYLGISVGISNRLNIGISYGGDGLIGRGKPRGNPYPGGLIKYRIIEESYHIPGISLGYDHQGYGGIEDSSYLGFVYKSQGFFVALSKNYLLFSKLQFGLHGAVNFSLEDIKQVKWPNCYIGLDIGINEELALAIEYDLGLNQKDLHDETYLNPLRGILNLGLRWSFDPQLYLEFDTKDILQHKRVSNNVDQRIGWSRELKIVYVTSF